MTKSTLQRLISYPHAAVFDGSPEPELAFRLQHPLGARWKIIDRVMTVYAGEDSWSFGLRGLTVDTLCDLLMHAGFTLESRASRFTGVAAEVLIEGEGNERTSNGDHVYAFTSLLWALMSAYTDEVRAAEYQVGQALRQMVITTAEKEWLDLWGTLYGVPRMQGEADGVLRERIPDEAFRIRVNGLAIEDAIKRTTGKDVEIREPWKLMFRSSVSALSGAHHLHDADYYTYHIIHPVAQVPFDWTDVLQAIERNRAAGVLMYAPAIELTPRHVLAQPPAEYLVTAGRLDTFGIGAWPGGERPLGVMRLDDNEFTLNHPMVAFQVRTFGNVDGVQTDQSLGNVRDIAYAAITLSDGVPLGDENALLSRGQERYTSYWVHGHGPVIQWQGAWDNRNWFGDVGLPPVVEINPKLSNGLKLSAYEVEHEIRRVERITLETHGALVDAAFTLVLNNGREDVRSMQVAVYDGLNGWSGPWGTGNWLGWRWAGMKQVAGPYAAGATAYNDTPLSDLRLSNHEFIINHGMAMSSTTA